MYCDSQRNFSKKYSYSSIIFIKIDMKSIVWFPGDNNVANIEVMPITALQIFNVSIVVKVSKIWSEVSDVLPTKRKWGDRGESPPGAPTFTEILFIQFNWKSRWNLEYSSFFSLQTMFQIKCLFLTLLVISRCELLF